MKIQEIDLPHTVRKKVLITLTEMDLMTLKEGITLAQVEGYSHMYVIRKGADDEG